VHFDIKPQIVILQTIYLFIFQLHLTMKITATKEFGNTKNNCSPIGS